VPLPAYVDRLPVPRLEIPIEELDPRPVDLRDFPFLERHDAPRVWKEGGDVARKEILALAQADHQRAIDPRRHQEPRSMGGHDPDRKASADLLERQHDRAEQIAPQLLVPLLDQVRDDLRIRDGREPVMLKPPPQFGVVLDDAVMDHRYLPVAREVR